MNLKPLMKLSAFKKWSSGYFFSLADFSLHVNLFMEMNIRKI
jgi:hypothetical protein